MYIVSGCSWACGEWARGDTGKGIIHSGLDWNFEQDNVECLNLGIPGGSNYQVAKKISGWFERFPDKKVEEIVVWQTEWTRDVRMIFEEDYENLKSITDLQNIIISRFYDKLSYIAQQYNTRVNLIGGTSDTLWLDNIEKHYSGLRIICQSSVNFILNNEHRINDPVHSWYTAQDTDLVQKCKTILPPHEINNLISLINKGFERENLVFSNTDYFWPDGAHPNREAFKKVYNFIKEKF